MPCGVPHRCRGPEVKMCSLAVYTTRLSQLEWAYTSGLASCLPSRVFTDLTWIAGELHAERDGQTHRAHTWGAYLGAHVRP